jgi:lipopolysaccharide transport system permease protein
MTAPARPSRATYLRDLMLELVGRDMKLRYRRSVLGIFWSLVHPLAYLVVLTFVFQAVTPLDIPNYPLFTLTGVLAWAWFSAALPAATVSITGNRELIRQPGFPVAVLPAVPVLSSLLHFALAMALVVAALVIGGPGLSPAVLALPLVAALQFAVTLSLGYIAATIQVRFRDTAYLVGALMLLGFFITPVFYRPGALPGRYQVFYIVNPMAQLISAYRDVLIEHRWPDLSALLVLGAVSSVALWFGHRVFTRASTRFAEET